MIRIESWRWQGRVLSALILFLAVATRPGDLVPSVGAQAAPHPPLSIGDLGSGWVLAQEGWIVPPEGVEAVGNYLAVFQREASQGITSRGPIHLTLNIDILPDTPPPDAVEQNITAFLSFAVPEGQARVFDQPDVGANTLWYSFDLDLSPALPDMTGVPAGVAYGVVFRAGNNIINMTTVGFVEQLGLQDAVEIARVVAGRMPSFSLVGA